MGLFSNLLKPTGYNEEIDLLINSGKDFEYICKHIHAILNNMSQVNRSKTADWLSKYKTQYWDPKHRIIFGMYGYALMGLESFSVKTNGEWTINVNYESAGKLTGKQFYLASGKNSIGEETIYIEILEEPAERSQIVQEQKAEADDDARDLNVINKSNSSSKPPVLKEYENNNNKNNEDFSNDRVESTLNKIKDTKVKSRKRVELKKLHTYVYSKKNEIEKSCGFSDDPGTSNSVYEGLIDWEDAAGFEFDHYREPWFYYMDTIDKVESSIDKLDSVLSENKVFIMLQGISHISFGKSLKSSISKEAMWLILEESLNELEAELVENYEKNYFNPTSSENIRLLFTLHSSTDHVGLLILSLEDADEEVKTIEVKQFYHNLYAKASYAISNFYSS